MPTATIPTIQLSPNYRPSVIGWNFHTAPQQFRILVAGVKSGKTFLGAYETVRYALANPGSVTWAVAPTNRHLKVAWAEVQNILNQFDGVVQGRNMARHVIRLTHGGVIEFQTADRPDNLRAPNLDAIWIDEPAYIKNEAWRILKSRLAARKHAEMWMTTTPNGRNWFWNACIECGMPSKADYGIFTRERTWIAHFPTWQFDWVEDSFIAQEKRSLPRDYFDQEYGAMFTSEANEVFSQVEAALHWEMLPTKFEGSTVIGVDLAKKQDFSAVVVMTGSGRVIHVEHWNQTTWSIQKVRLEQIANEWNGIIILDVSNAGSVIEEDLRATGVRVFSVNMHDPLKKREIIEGLQIAFEGKRILIPHYKAGWSTKAHLTLYEELKSYQSSLTRGGRISYAAPDGFHDDLVIALALAYHGKSKGQAGGINAVTEVMVPRTGWKPGVKRPNSAARQRIHARIFGRHSAMGGMGRSGPFWG